jgi:hypothetical protein
MSTQENCAHQCKAEILGVFQRLNPDIEVHVTTVPPIFGSPYDTLDMRCPHGVIWHMEPTTDQQAQWARDGVS